MKLTKAIEIGELNIKEAGKQMPPDCLNALKLLVEAAKAVGNARANNYYTPIPLLPGEADE